MLIGLVQNNEVSMDKMFLNKITIFIIWFKTNLWQIWVTDNC